MTIHPEMNWTADQITEALRLGTSDGLKNMDRWKNRLVNTWNNPDFASFWADIQAYEQKAVKENLPELSFSLYRQFRENGERKAYEKAYFERRGRLAALGLLAAASPTSERLHLLEDLIWSVCNEQTWCLSAHVPAGEEAGARSHIDLFAAETAQMLAEMIILMNDVLDERVLGIVRAEIERRIFTPLYREERTYGWEEANHNWSAVCSGGCGIAALLLLEDEKLRVRALQHTIHSMNAFLSGYGLDGGCAEGIGYWVYGFGFYTYFAEMLRMFTAGELDMLSGPKTEAIAAFPGNIHLSEGVFVNYSDSRERETIPPGQLSLWSTRMQVKVNWPFHIPLLTEDPCRRWAHALRNVVWSEPEVFAVESKALELTAPVYLENLSWTIAKGVLAAGDKNEMMVAFSAKGGHNAEPHNHNDLGHFILHGGGENILCDPGSGEYTQAYFSPGRERIFQIGSHGHSVPTIEGTVQISGRQAEAQVLKVNPLSRHRVEVAFDLTSAYADAPTLSRYIRRLTWSCPPEALESELLVEDHYQWQQRLDTARMGDPKTDPRVVEHFISRVKPVLHEGLVRWEGNRAAVIMHYDACGWDAQMEVVDTVDHDHLSLKLYRTALSLRQTADKDADPQDRSEQETWCRLRFTIHPRRYRG